MMGVIPKSATQELLEYFEREGISYAGDPYVNFQDIPCETIITKSNGLFNRIECGRWLVQWWGKEVGPREEVVQAVGILNFLERIVANNKEALESVA